MKLNKFEQAEHEQLRVRVVVVTYRNQTTVGRCLGSLRSTRAALDVVVFDNASDDETVKACQGSHSASVIQSAENIGFARAVNVATKDCSGVDFVLLVNPDAFLDDCTIDTLLECASAHPNAGLYGAQGRHPTGNVDKSSVQGPPSLAAALRIATAVATGLELPADKLERQGEVCPVPALCGAVLLIRAETWYVLGGFDPQFYLYSEDIDLCLRASDAGFQPVFVPLAGYVHIGGSSSKTNADRLCRILAGLVTLYKKHRPRTAAFAVLALQAGAAWRAVLSRVTGRADWPETWRRRAEWYKGYPPVTPAVGPN